MNTKSYIINLIHSQNTRDLPSIGRLKLSTKDATKFVQLHQEANAFLKNLQTKNITKDDACHVKIPCTSLPSFTLCEENNTINKILSHAQPATPQPITSHQCKKCQYSQEYDQIPKISISPEGIQFITEFSDRHTCFEIFTEVIPIGFFHF